MNKREFDKGHACPHCALGRHASCRAGKCICHRKDHIVDRALAARFAVFLRPDLSAAGPDPEVIRAVLTREDLEHDVLVVQPLEHPKPKPVRQVDVAGDMEFLDNAHWKLGKD